MFMSCRCLKNKAKSKKLHCCACWKYCLEQIRSLEIQIEDAAMEIPKVELLKTIPGIGDKLAATLIAEIGDANQFEDPKQQLVAYAGLDPSVHSSGQFVASSTRITK